MGAEERSSAPLFIVPLIADLITYAISQYIRGSIKYACMIGTTQVVPPGNEWFETLSQICVLIGERLRASLCQEIAKCTLLSISILLDRDRSLTK